MLLYDTIGVAENGTGISGQAFAYEMQYLQNNGITECDIHINSGGGSVIDGYAIVSAMLHSKMKITAYNDGMAASIAGVIFQAAQNRIMMDYAINMVHCATMEDDPDEQDINALNAINASLTTILSSKCKADVNIPDLMKAESWFDSSTSLEMGLCDSIVKTGKKVDLPAKKNANSLYLIYNSIIQENDNDMKENLISLLGLKNDASDASIVASVSKAVNNTDSKELADKVAALEKENAELKAQVSEVADKAADTVVENAIKAGKIKAEQKPFWLNSAKANYTETSEILNSMPVLGKAHGLGSTVNMKKTAAELAADTNEAAEMGFSEMSKKDPKALANIQKNNPAKFKAMYEAQYAVNMETGKSL